MSRAKYPDSHLININTLIEYAYNKNGWSSALRTVRLRNLGGDDMANIIPSSDLRNKYNEIFSKLREEYGFEGV